MRYLPRTRGPRGPPDIRDKRGSAKRQNTKRGEFSRKGGEGGLSFLSGARDSAHVC